MLDASSGGAFIFKSYEEGYKFIGSITTNTYQWPVTRFVVVSTQKKPIGVHEVTKTTTLATQVAHIHQMMKNIVMSPDVPATESVKVVTDASKVACVYYGGAHLFEYCSANPVSVNYVGNNKYNNPLQQHLQS